MQVDRICVRDNGSRNLADINRLLQDFPSAQLECNVENRGMSVALNQVTNWAHNLGYKWIILLDQDSVCSEDLLEKLTGGDISPAVAIVSPEIIDRSDSYKPMQSNSNRQSQLNFCITSGSIIRVSAWQALAGYDENIFIDFVDFDFCLRVRSAGMEIIRRHDAWLLHEIGKIKRFGPIRAYNYSPFRSYHMARDMIYYAKKHSRSPVALRVQKRGTFGTLLVILRKIIVAALFERNRLSSVKALIRGAVDGLLGAPPRA